MYLLKMSSSKKLLFVKTLQAKILCFKMNIAFLYQIVIFVIRDQLLRKHLLGFAMK